MCREGAVGERPLVTMPFGEAEVHHGSIACHSRMPLPLPLPLRLLLLLLLLLVVLLFYVISANETNLNAGFASLDWVLLSIWL